MRMTFETMQCNNYCIKRPGQSNVLRLVIEVQSYNLAPLRKCLIQVICFREKDNVFNSAEKKVHPVWALARFELLHFVTPILCSTAMLKTQPWRAKQNLWCTLHRYKTQWKVCFVNLILILQQFWAFLSLMLFLFTYCLLRDGCGS